jgi:sporulation integral membrane protein YtvI
MERGKTMIRFITKRRLWIAISIIIGAVLTYIILPVSFPLILAFLTALLLEPFVRTLQNTWKIKRNLSVLIVFIIFICFMALCGYFITTKVISEIIQLINRSPMYFNEISKMWFRAEDELVKVAKDLPKVVVNQFTSQVQQFLHHTRESILSYVNIDNLKAILTNIPNYLVSFIIYLVSLFLFLIDLPKMSENLYSHFTEKTAKKVKFMTSRLSFTIFNFIKAQFFISIIIFIITFFSLFFIAPEIALYMSLLIWVLDFIPIFGTLIVLAPWALYHLITGNLLLAFLLASLGFILLIVKSAIKQKLLGRHFGLSPLATLTVMYLGFKIIGVVGIIAGPLFLTIFYAAKEAGIIQTQFKI